MPRKFKSAGIRLSLRAKFIGIDRIEVVAINETTSETLAFSIPLDWKSITEAKTSTSGRNRPLKDLEDDNPDGESDELSVMDSLTTGGNADD